MKRSHGAGTRLAEVFQSPRHRGASAHTFVTEFAKLFKKGSVIYLCFIFKVLCCDEPNTI